MTQAAPALHGREFHAVTGLAPDPRFPELEDQALALYPPSPTTHGAPRDLRALDQQRRAVNQQVIDRALEELPIHELPMVDVLALITSVMTREALMRTTLDESDLKPVEGNLVRTNGEDVFHPREIALPLVTGENVAQALCELIDEMETEFENLDPETAIMKACVYFNLSMLIHPQRDFNTRVNNTFFDYLIGRAIRQRGQEENPAPPKVFRESDRDLKERYLFPLRGDLRFKMVQRLFPEIASLPDPKRFCDLVFPRIFTHTYNAATYYDELSPGDGFGSLNMWTVIDPTGINSDDMSQEISMLLKAGIDSNQLLARMKQYERFDSQPGYFQEALQTSKEILAELLGNALPVVKEMHKRNMPMNWFHYLQVYREIHGSSKDPELNSRNFLYMIFWAMETYSSTTSATSTLQEPTI